VNGWGWLALVLLGWGLLLFLMLRWRSRLPR
jgi:hypothetical protein